MSKKVRRILTTVIIVAAVIVLTVIMVLSTSNRTRENAIDQMESLTQEQSIMILNYVDHAEDTLSAYASANEITELLLDPDNASKVSAAQKYTENFSRTVEGLEGIYVSKWNTQVLAHTNAGTVGMITRKDEGPLNELRNAMLAAGEGVYNTGIINSPATGRQIVSMYKAIYNDRKEPIGLVGLGIYTDSLANALNSLKLNTKGAKFTMVNTATGKYIFCNDPVMVGADIDNSDIKSICSDIQGERSDKTDYRQSKDTILFYSYMAANDWLLSIESPSDEVFDFSRTVNRNMIVFCTVCIILIIIFNIISIKQYETAQRLETSRKKQALITKNLHTAALKDILTDVNNRIKFIDDFSKDENGNYKIQDCPDNPYCFAMFNLTKFSQINIMFGHDSGDAALAATADVLKEHFQADNVYRTGSDEFVVALQKSPESVVEEVNNVLAELRAPRNIGNLLLSITYSAAVVKRSSAISPVVLIALKDLLNNAERENPNTEKPASFIDMDNV